MQYPLEEKIGYPHLLIGREQEFKNFHKWIANMPKKLSKSRAILGRRKSGKTAFVQRLFNELWSANGQVIPFYYSIPDRKTWYPDFAIDYFKTFATQYISFMERDPKLMDKLLTLEEIRTYGEASGNDLLAHNVNSILIDKAERLYGSMWGVIYRTPHSMAAIHNQRILVIIDEFQYISNSIYAREDLSGEPIGGMAGSFHEVSESKVAPMLATGSYVGWMIDIMSKHLEAGRLSRIPFSPYLTEDEGLQAVYKYAEVYDEPISNETAVEINALCMSDPFFISCVMQSNYPGRDLTTSEGVVEVVNYEITDRTAELFGTWYEYIEKTVDRINEKYGKDILLHLNKYNDRSWTPKELKEVLQLEEDEKMIFRKLIYMAKGDLIQDLSSNIQFQGLQDGTLNLILRNRFEEEIAEHQPDLRVGFRDQIAKLQKENRTLRGKLSHIVGKTAEQQLANAFRSRKRFRLSDFFADVADDSPLNLIHIRTRITIQRDDGKAMELDVVAESNDDRVLLVEVRKRKKKTNVQDIEDFQEKVVVYQSQHPEQKTLAAFLSIGSFTEEAIALCQANGIGWASELHYL